MCVLFPPFFTPSVSEIVIPDFEVGRTESVESTILCNPRIPISEPWLCTAICGPSPMLNTLTLSASVSAEAGASATIRLPLLTERTYYCVVNATTDDDTVTVLRGRLTFNLSGMFIYMYIVYVHELTVATCMFTCDSVGVVYTVQVHATDKCKKLA